MVFNFTHSQFILRYKENGGKIEPYSIVIMPEAQAKNIYLFRPGTDDLKTG
jgi:hypothetical protein